MKRRKAGTMTVTREIAINDWQEYLHAFSEQNQGRPVRMEASALPGEGPPLRVEHEPLMGVAFEPKGSAAPAILVTLGGTDLDAPHMTHMIHAPTHLWAEEDMAGRALALDIDSDREGKTLLMFEQMAELHA
jgi:hypothetical protein